MNPRIFISLILCAVFSSSFIFAQEHLISGQVHDVYNQPISFANVIVFNLDESEIIGGTSTDELGMFGIGNLASGQYILKVSFVGYESLTKPLTIPEETIMGILILEEALESLDEISVLVKKPTIKRLADRLVFNVAKTALSDGNMLDVLRNTPMVMVTGDEIKVKRITPTVYINDRKINLSGSEIIQLLENTPAKNIKSVEIITSPGANYDASSGTVIKITMDKNLISGYRGSVFTNYKQGVFPSYEIGTSSFYKDDKISFSGGYTFSKDKIKRHNDDAVTFLKPDGSPDNIWNSAVGRNTWSETHNANLTFDYAFNKNNNFRLSSLLLATPYFKYRTHNKTQIFDESSTFISSFKSYTQSRDDQYNLAFDADYTSKFDNDSKLTFNAHYTNYDYVRKQNVSSDYFLTNNSLDYGTAFKSQSGQTIDIFTTQADFDLPLNDNSSLAIGVKGSFVTADSSMDQFDIINNQDVLNSTDDFNYKENIFATYVQFSQKFEKFNLEAGLRMEQTDIEGTSMNIASNQNYLEWFPSVTLSHNLSENITLYTNYERTISRPAYQSLNPFEFFLNDKVSIVGNPNLKPSFNERLNLGISINDTHTFEAHIGKIKGNINELPIQDNTTKILTYIPQNIGETTEFGVSYETNLTLFTKLNVYFVTEVYYIDEDTQIENQAIQLNKWSNYSLLSGNMSFLKDNSLITYVSLLYSSENLQGLKLSRPQFLSELTISKTIWKKRATLSLIASDLFNAADFKAATNYLNQRSTQFTNLDNRYLKLRFTYNFGNTTLKNMERSQKNQERDRIIKRD